MAVGISGCGADAEVTTGGAAGGGEGTAVTSAIGYSTGSEDIVISVPGVYIAGDGRVFRPDPAGRADDVNEDVDGGASDGSDEVTEQPESAASIERDPAQDPTAFGRVAARPNIVALDVLPPEPIPLTVAQITPEGMDRLLNKADEIGVLDDSVDPPTGEMLWSTLHITTDRGVVERAYVSRDDPKQPETAEFAALAQDLDTFLGEDITEPEPYLPHAWRIEDTYGHTYEPVRPWPLDDTPEVRTCVVLPSDAERDSATGQFDDGTRAYSAFPAYPWECTEVE